MSSVEYLREFVNERLSAAAEEIFRVFKQTVVEYEEEIDRQRRLLDNVCQLEIKLHRIELPQQHVCKEEEVLTDQQLCNQERNSSLDQEDPEPPQIKEEQEELCIHQEGEQLVLKQEETGPFMLTPTHEESDHSEDQTLYLSPDKTLSAADTESVVNVPVKSSVVPEPNSDLQLLCHNSHVAESQDERRNKYGDSGDAEAKQNSPQHESNSLTNNVYNPTISEIDCSTHACTKSYKCDTCAKYFKCKSELQRHMRIHTGEKPYSCNSCGKRFTQTSHLKTHVKIHTGEKPHLCKTCGKGFIELSHLKAHMRTHTGEKPHLCKTCGERFIEMSNLKAHMRIHTGEKPFTCKTCGRAFRRHNDLTVHMRTHTGEKPYPCDTCGKRFSQISTLNAHIKIHTGEKPYCCNICGKRFSETSLLKKHIRVHTGEKPYSCETCGRDFKSRTGLKKHKNTHN